MLSHIKDNRDCYTVVVANQSFTFNSSHQDYATLVEAIKEGDEAKFVSTWQIGKKIENWSYGDFRIGDGLLRYRDEIVNDSITERVITMIKEGFDCQPMLKFLENLYNNPSYRAVQELYVFLRHKYLPITEDGCFLAYKAIRPDYKDKYSGQFDNSVGQVVTMPRFRVDDNCDQGCSQGLHVGAIDYVRNYASPGDKVVICKVNPADVVSVPLDCEQQKVRCCRYEVVAEYEGELLSSVHVEDQKDVDDFYDEDNEFSEDNDSVEIRFWESN